MKGIERARDRKRWERWRVTWGGGEKRERKLQAGGVSLNETRGSLPVCVWCVWWGSYVFWRGLAACVWICMLLFCRWAGHIWNFRIWATDQEFSSWGVRRGRGGGGGGVWGRRMAMQGGLYGGRNGLSLSPLFPSFPPLHTSQSSCPSPHSLYQAEREDRREDVPPLYWNKLKRDPPEEKKKNHCIQEHSKKESPPVSIARLWRKSNIAL